MLKAYLARVAAGESLSEADARAAMEVIMSGGASEIQVGALLTALRMKGVSGGEVAGFARAMRRRAKTVACSRPALIDTCGTGGDGKGTFNISTTVAFVAAGAGLTVAKHGNRGISSACGSADVLAELDVAVDLPPEAVARILNTVGIAFMYAPVFHEAVRHAARPRRELGFRTVFNLLGPLANPAGARRQLIGVYDPALAATVAEALAALGADHAMVVSGLDGLDEISASAPTRVLEVKGGAITASVIDPRAFGFGPCPPEAYRGGGPAENARIMLRLLQGEQGPRRDIVLLNAAAALVVGGAADSIREGLSVAAASIDSGAALAKLAALREAAGQERGRAE